MKQSNLNSILIEGYCIGSPSTEERKDEKNICRFRVVNHRFEMVKGVVHTRSVIVSILTFGRLAEVCAEYMRDGKKVRIVGRLDENENHHAIVAEHVEFRPVTADQEEKET